MLCFPLFAMRQSFIAEWEQLQHDFSWPCRISSLSSAQDFGGRWTSCWWSCGQRFRRPRWGRRWFFGACARCLDFISSSFFLHFLSKFFGALAEPYTRWCSGSEIKESFENAYHPRSQGWGRVGRRVGYGDRKSWTRSFVGPEHPPRLQGRLRSRRFIQNFDVRSTGTGFIATWDTQTMKGFFVLYDMQEYDLKWYDGRRCASSVHCAKAGRDPTLNDHLTWWRASTLMKSWEWTSSLWGASPCWMSCVGVLTWCTSRSCPCVPRWYSRRSNVDG